MKSNNVIELTPYLGRNVVRRKKRRKSVTRTAFFAAALDALCYLTLLVCLMIGAGALAVLV